MLLLLLLVSFCVLGTDGVKPKKIHLLYPVKLLTASDKANTIYEGVASHNEVSAWVP